MIDASLMNAKDFLLAASSAMMERQHAVIRLLMLDADIKLLESCKNAEECTKHLLEYREELKNKLVSCWKVTSKAARMIEVLPDQRHRVILKQRYINSLSWPEIQEYMLTHHSFAYEERQIFRLHNSALAALQKVMLEQGEGG